MTSRRSTTGSAANLGTFAGVFTPSVLTILGIILFLRLGFVVGTVGLSETFVVMGLSTALALVTSISLSAIATNLRVKGGGVYYLISRSLGGEYGGALGILLFVAQSVSIAFYCIGFGEALGAILPFADAFSSGFLSLPRLLAGGSALTLFALAWLGVDWATRLQFGIMTVLATALVSFFFGGIASWNLSLFSTNWQSDGSALGFWQAFAIFFPAVTGFTQGANMSGDLKNPERSLPLGVLSSVGISSLIYLFVAVLLAGCLPGESLQRSDSMKHVARIGWLIDAGIVAAALSSALASFMGAPRILQSLAADRVFPFLLPFASGHGPGANPRRGTLLSAVIALATIGLGNLNLIAPVVSMFFLLSYGLLNLATYVEAAGASPAFRPRFRWFHKHLSLLGAFGCLGAMLAIDAIAGALALSVLFAIQQFLHRSSSVSGWTDGLHSFNFQRMRRFLLSMTSKPDHPRDWRPRLLTLSSNPACRGPLLRFAAWIEAGSGLNTTVRILVGNPEEMCEERTQAEEEMRQDLEAHEYDAFALAVVAPDVHSGVLALLQAYGVGPLRANSLLLNWIGGRADNEKEVMDVGAYGNQLRAAVRMGCNVLVLHAPENEWLALEFVPERHRRIDVWWCDDASSRLMLLLAHLIKRNVSWANAKIRLFSPRGRRGTEKTLLSLQSMLREARIEAEARVVIEPDLEAIVEHSSDASLVLLPLRMRGKQPEGPFGERLQVLLKRLPLTVLVRAVDDIDLTADPEQSEAFEISSALEAASDAIHQASRVEKLAERARNEAERKLLRAEGSGETKDDVQQLRLAREAEEASRSAQKLAREAKKARAAAQAAAANAQEVASHAPRPLRRRATELALQVHDPGDPEKDPGQESGS